MFKGRYIFGVGLILLGILFLISQTFNLHYTLGMFLEEWWPIIFVIWGADGLKRGKGIFFNSALILGGLLIIATYIFHFAFDFWDIFFPVCLILFGVSVIVGKNRKKYNNYFEKMNNYGSNVYGSDYLSINAVLSGVNEKNETGSYNGGEVNVVFGSAKLDLRNSNTTSAESMIEANVVFGSFELIVPEDWIVELNGTPVFGDVKNNTKPNIENKSHIIRINYNLVFGDIKIKNW